MVRWTAAALMLAVLLLPAPRPAAQESAPSASGQPAQAQAEGAQAPTSLPEPAEAVAGQETRRILLCFELAPGASFSRDEQLLFYESLLVQLGSASVKLAVIESPGRKDASSDSDRTTLARSLGADSWLRVILDGDWSSAAVTASSYDLLALQNVFQFELRKPLRRGAVDLERDFWREVIEAAVGYYSTAAASKTLPGEVVFQARPRARLQVSGGQSLRADEAGQARLAVQLPLTLSVRARSPGYYPLESKYYVSQELTTLTLEPARGARMAFDVYLNNVIFPGFEFSWFLLRSTAFVRAGFTTYLAGLRFSGDSREESLFVSRTLNLLDLAFGSYLNDADRNLRVYAGAGAFLRLVTSLAWFGLEPIAPWGLQGVLGVEYSRNLKRRFYLEFDPLLYFTSQPELLVASLSSSRDYLGYAFFPRAAAYFLNFRLGFRWQI